MKILIQQGWDSSSKILSYIDAAGLVNISLSSKVSKKVSTMMEMFHIYIVQYTSH